jgi:glucose/arabinose dehydrogenase/regulation of enolase protein 1 (concanavalin A-like superfamily)
MRQFRRIVNQLLIAIMVLTSSPLVMPQTAQAAPPAGFQTTQVIGSGLEGPSGFEIAPDGRIFILERTGKIKIFKNGQLLPTPFAELPSVAAGDRGLIGIAFDPAFNVNCYVYFYYTAASDLLNRLVRFNACGDVGTDGPLTIYQTYSPSQELHVGGSIQFGPDGKMYFAVGDNGYPPNAQSLSNPHGKIMRINKDGSVPTDNPFVGTPGALPEIWAYGLRNPWRFQFDSANGEMYGSDVGDYTWEEMNHLVRGGNYGWPLTEGTCTANCAGLINPIYTYNHNGDSAAAVGGPIYRAGMFPAEYKGSLFFADYAQGFIKRIKLDAAGNSTGVVDFDTNAGSVVDMKIAPDGSMYYITYYPGRLYRVSYNTGNQVPTANATADKTKGLEPLTVNFSSAGSSDPDGQPLTYLWNFGDGTTSTAANPTKTFTAKGTYTVELTVSDGTNSAGAIPVVIQVGTPPSVNISVPAPNSTYRAGEAITYNAFATDSAGFDLNDAQISTDVIYHHDTHTHPFLDNLIGRSNTFTIPDHGEAAANTWYEISVTATDQSGVSATKTVNIYPRTIDVTYSSSPADIGFYLDGVPITTPRTAKGVEGFKREVAAYPIKQGADGQMYQFDRWSDGGAIRHQFINPAANTTINAFYSPAPSFNAQYYPNTTLAGAPSLTRQDPKIDFNWEFGSPAASLPVDGFSARWTKNQSFAAGRYKFTTATDDGVRLYIDGKVVIDQWQGQNAAHTAIVDLTAGLHEIKMEYFESGGGALARLNWDTTPDQPASTGYSAQYFNNRTLTGAPTVQRTDATIDFDWAGGSPDPAIPADNFSARWTKASTFTAGNYEFTVRADDGVRLYIDDKLVIDKWIDQGPTTYATVQNLTAGTHTIKLEYYERGGGAVAKFSYAATNTPPPTPTGCPAGWTCSDVGITGPAGSATESGGTYTVKGSGWDVWGGDDQMHYVWKPLTGDGTITARVASQSNTNPWAKSGVMIKETATPGSKYAAMLTTPTNGLKFQYNFTGDISGGAGAAPTWVRLTRSGNTFTAYKSADGLTWTTVGVTNLTMAATVTAGLFVTAHNGEVLNTSTFDNVSLTGPGVTGLPSPWDTRDIGSATPGGSATTTDGSSWTVKGGGGDIWDDVDQFRYVHQPLNGDGSIIARVSAQSNTNPWAKSGVMIKESATTGANYAAMAITPANGYRFQYNFTGDIAGGAYTAPNSWVKLTRTGSTFTAAKSADGVNWTTVGSTTISMIANVTIGLFVSSHDPGVLNTTTFDNVSVSTSAATLPAPWIGADVGTPMLAGSSSFSGGTYSITGAGWDIWQDVDQFQYAYQTRTGDATITARITGQSPTNPWAKSGVMIRDTAAPNKPYAMLAATPEHGLLMQYNLTGSIDGGAYAFPYWLRLTRVGNVVTAYKSANGTAWTQVGQVTLALSPTATIGLFTTSHDGFQLGTATFDNVTVTQP